MRSFITFAWAHQRISLFIGVIVMRKMLVENFSKLHVTISDIASVSNKFVALLKKKIRKFARYCVAIHNIRALKVNYVLLFASICCYKPLTDLICRFIPLYTVKCCYVPLHVPLFLYIPLCALVYALEQIFHIFRKHMYMYVLVYIRYYVSVLTSLPYLCQNCEVVYLA